jgi:hypothetical protein
MQRNNFAVLSMESNSTTWISAGNGAGNSPIPTLLNGEYPGYLHIKIDLAVDSARLFVMPSVTAVDGDINGWCLRQMKGTTVILNVFGYKYISWLAQANVRFYMTPLTDH